MFYKEATTIIGHFLDECLLCPSLASRPAGGLLASCSSGDGQVKMWSCGLHSNFGASSFLSGPASSTIHSKLYEDDGSKAVEEASSPERCHLPSRSLSTYLASRPGQPSDQQNPSCRVSMWAGKTESTDTPSLSGAGGWVARRVCDGGSGLSSRIPVLSEGIFGWVLAEPRFTSESASSLPGMKGLLSLINDRIPA